MNELANQTQGLIATWLPQAMAYPEYEDLLHTLLAQTQTTGSDQSERMVEYTRLNVHRMQRLEKTVLLANELLAALQILPRKLTWLVLTEGWCGDAAQNLPVLAKIAKASTGKINMQLLLRDQSLPLMDAYLTNGTRSIPKLICLDATTGEALGTWGPRPAAVQTLVEAHKANPQGVSHEEFTETVHRWYAKDKSEHLQKEMTALLLLWSNLGKA